MNTFRTLVRPRAPGQVPRRRRPPQGHADAAPTLDALEGRQLLSTSSGSAPAPLLRRAPPPTTVVLTVYVDVATSQTLAARPSGPAPRLARSSAC